MKEVPTIEDAVSIVPVRDVRHSVKFYVNLLGFEERSVSEDENFAIIIHGEAAIHLVKTDSEDALNATANHISIYLWVNHIDALYDQLAPNLDTLPEGRVRTPFTQSYGMREFHVKDPDGCLLLFGENV